MATNDQLGKTFVRFNAKSSTIDGVDHRLAKPLVLEEILRADWTSEPTDNVDE